MKSKMTRPTTSKHQGGAVTKATPPDHHQNQNHNNARTEAPRTSLPVLFSHCFLIQKQTFPGRHGLTQDGKYNRQHSEHKPEKTVSGEYISVCVCVCVCVCCLPQTQGINPECTGPETDPKELCSPSGIELGSPES